MRQCPRKKDSCAETSRNFGIFLQGNAFAVTAAKGTFSQQDDFEREAF
jgi:hypothetical protein